MLKPGLKSSVIPPKEAMLMKKAKKIMKVRDKKSSFTIAKLSEQ